MTLPEPKEWLLDEENELRIEVDFDTKVKLRVRRRSPLFARDHDPRKGYLDSAHGSLILFAFI